jgi:4-oxalocrotonate tautomerase
MPTLHVEWLAGRSQEVKNKVAQELTQVMVNSAGVEPDHVYILFHDIAATDWAVGGKFFPAPPPAK